MRWLMGCAGVCLLCLTLLLILVRIHEPSTSSLIAFVSDRGGNEDIYLMDINGQHVRPLIQNPAYDWYPSWSPDGQKIAFVSDRNGTHDIFIYDLKTRQTRQLTNFDALERYPAWTPDGKTIYFVTDKDGFYTALYQIHLDGSGLRPVTAREDDIWSPDVSPDGRRLVFTARTSAFRNRLFTWETDKRSEAYLSEENWDYFFPRWSPDGKTMLFNSFGQTSDDNIYLLGMENQDIIQLTEGYAEDRMADWSPDGKSIVFMSRRNGNWDIYHMGKDGSNVRAITDYLGSDWSPAWSPIIDLPWRWWVNGLGSLILLAYAKRRLT